MKLPWSSSDFRSLVAAVLAIAFPFEGVLGACEEQWASSVEGVYALQEWHTEAGVLKPPAVEGRFVLKDKAVVTILHNMSDDSKKTALASFGDYRAEGCRFSYRYNNRSLFTETPGGVTVSRTLQWDGMREFDVTSDGEAIIFRSANGDREFNFSPKGLRYSENGSVLRVWSKVPKE